MECEENHYCYRGEDCPVCGSPIDDYGNTEGEFKFCCFPDCGCDGARLCIAPSGASSGSLSLNIERGSLRVLRNKK